VGLGVLLQTSQVCLRSLMDLLPSCAADLVLCARVAGSFSPLPSSQPTIKDVIVAYDSLSTRWCAVHWRAGSQ
jgi:hypothetical protein